MQRPPTRPGNVYGEERHPTDIQRDVEWEGQWQRMLEHKLGSSLSHPAGQQETPTVPFTPQPSSDTPLPRPESEDEVEQNLSILMEEGGVETLNHLLAHAIPPDSEPLSTSNIREWSFKDILCMPLVQQKEWKTACHEELDSLCLRDVFELVDPPKGRKIIKNCWVFDIKSDGRKKARLVAKGFSQVEGVNYNKIFSPVVRYETVRLMLALAALVLQLFLSFSYTYHRPYSKPYLFPFQTILR